jgi:hypothetical protein
MPSDSRAIGADWHFVGQEMAIALIPGSLKTQIQAGLLRVGLGAIALSKTFGALTNPHRGLSNVYI